MPVTLVLDYSSAAGHHDYTAEDKTEFKKIMKALEFTTSRTLEDCLVETSVLETHPMAEKVWLERHSRKADASDSIADFKNIYYPEAKAEDSTFDDSWPPPLDKFSTPEYWGLEAEGCLT